MKNDKVTVATHVGEHGDHVVGGAVGAAVGGVAGIAAAAAAGAATGTVAGPIGTIAGAAVGGVIGALAGKGIAQDVNPTTEDAYWANNYKTRPYVESNSDYDTYRPAYRHGIDAYGRYEGQQFDSIEPQLSNDWNSARGTSNLSWDKAKPAARDAYERLYNRTATNV